MLSRRNQAVLASVFATPTAAGIRFAEAERLIKALGGELRQGRGSRVRFLLGGVMLILHKPHPRPVLKKYQVEDVRDFLERAGYAPE